jgi:hypothetical protein
VRTDDIRINKHTDGNGAATEGSVESNRHIIKIVIVDLDASRYRVCVGSKNSFLFVIGDGELNRARICCLDDWRFFWV